MYEKAIAKIKNEMAVDAEDGMIVEIGEFLCHWLSRHKDAAGAVLAGDKSLSGAAEAIRNTAGRVRGKCVAIGAAASQRIILAYYDLDDAPKPVLYRGGVAVPLEKLA